jgi:hypothetical protein
VETRSELLAAHHAQRRLLANRPSKWFVRSEVKELQRSDGFGEITFLAGHVGYSLRPTAHDERAKKHPGDTKEPEETRERNGGKGVRVKRDAAE